VFDGASHLHLARRKRNVLLDKVDEILDTVERPDFREQDPIPGRERFYRQNFSSLGTWLLVVVDFNESPGWVVTVFVSELDPRSGGR
jgi:hypothetical protein